MPVANIFQQYLQPVKSVADYQADYDAQDLRAAQLGNAQRANALADLQFGMQKADIAQKQQQQNALMALYADPANRDPLARENAMINNPLLADKGYAMQKERLANAKTEAETGKYKAESSKVDIENQKAKLDASIRQLTMLSSPDEARASIQADMQKGTLPAHIGQSFLDSLNTPNLNFATWRNNHLAKLLDAKDQLARTAPKPTEVRLGDRVAMIDTNPDSPTYKQEVTSSKVGTSPDTIANNATSIKTTAMNNATTMRGQDMTDARQRDQNAIAQGAQSVKNETELRKEFEGLPEVKNYKQAYPSYAAITDAAKRSSPMADINLVYGLAKLYDPNSVVREGEYATVANAPGMPERIKGWVQYVQGGGKLTPDVKRQIIEEAKSRINTYGGEFEKAAQSYMPIVTQRGGNAANVMQATGDFEAGGKRKSLPTDEPQGMAGAKPGVKPQGGPAQVKNDADYNALPSGAMFIGPDGKTRRKP